MNVHLELGTLVRDYRTKKGMTQLDLSKKLGYDSTQFVSLFERGLSKIPLNTLGQLIVILGIPERKVRAILLEAYEAQMKKELVSGKEQAQNSKVG